MDVQECCLQLRGKSLSRRGRQLASTSQLHNLLSHDREQLTDPSAAQSHIYKTDDPNSTHLIGRVNVEFFSKCTAKRKPGANPLVTHGTEGRTVS